MNAVRTSSPHAAVIANEPGILAHLIRQRAGAEKSSVILRRVINGKTVSLVIPSLNEEEGVVATIQRAGTLYDEVLVVDGGSSDRTAANAEALGAVVIPQLVRGYGLAYKTGFLQAKGDVIVTGDADGTYPVEMVRELLATMDERGLDFVSCTRFPLEHWDSMETLNSLGNRAISAFGSVVHLHYFRDLLSGMWIFRKPVLNELRLMTNGWNFSPEIKLEASYKLGKRFTELHIPYRDRVGMTHNVRPFRIGGENCAFIFYKRVSQLYRAYFMKRTEDQIRATRDKP
jgi:glycosyltransferase involved in cell wall biosynthesis